MNELEQAMREVVQQNAYMQHLGIEVESLSADYVCTKMPYKEELTNPTGCFMEDAFIPSAISRQDSERVWVDILRPQSMAP